MTYRVTTTYQEVGLTGHRDGVCPVCGKKGKRQRRFYQTLNPFNRNKKGEVKTRSEIYEELKEEISKWSKGQFVHAKCEE